MVRKIDPGLLAEVAAGMHYEPHAVLGAHSDGAGGVSIRVLRPLASTVRIETLEGVFDATHEHGGIWVANIDAEEPPDYRVHVAYDAGEIVQDDPYRFLPTLGDLDI